MKRIIILGSTGSIGTNALRVIGRFPGRFTIVGLSADANVETLAKQIKTHRPKAVALCDTAKVQALKNRLGTLRKTVRIYAGDTGIHELVYREKADNVVVAISGTAALVPTIKAIESGKDVALASKEALVTAGKMIMKLASRHNVKILPVDSEHSAIFQCLDGRSSKDHLAKIYLTGSGGPLRTVSKRDFDKLSRRDILRHPKWKMGKKITIDSATLMNKGLEVIEAHWLFGVPVEKIHVLIHPEAIIHSMVEFIDGSVLAQLAVPDMKLPILYALTYPERYPAVARQVDFSKAGPLSFFKPDVRKFPCLEMAYRVIKQGGLSPCALNAANEAAVRAYLEGTIKFSRIPVIIEQVLAKHKNSKEPSLTDILHTDQWAKEKVHELCQRR